MLGEKCVLVLCFVYCEAQLHWGVYGGQKSLCNFKLGQSTTTPSAVLHSGVVVHCGCAVHCVVVQCIVWLCSALCGCVVVQCIVQLLT